MMAPRLNKEGVYELTLPITGDSKIPLASARELGHVVAKVLENRDQFLGKKIAVASDYLTPNEMAATFSKGMNTKIAFVIVSNINITVVWKKPVKHSYISPQVFAKFPFPAAPFVAEMFNFYDQCGYFGEKVNGRGITIRSFSILYLFLITFRYF